MVNGKSSLFVFMNGLKVGTLFKQSQLDVSFQYDEAWHQSPFARPISLSMPLSSTVYKDQVVYNFLDNLLPENPDIRRSIQRLFQTESNSAFDLLAGIGHDCVGALQIQKSDTAATDNGIRAQILSESDVETLLKQYQVMPLGMGRQHEDFRISLAGAQYKTALLKKGNGWYLPLGATPTTHILKLPIGHLSHQNIDLSLSSENEWLCSRLLAAFGLPVANCEVMTFNAQKALVVERFDRTWTENGKRILRLPQEDFCQVLGLGSDLKYQADGGPGISDIMKVLLGSDKAHQDRTVFLKTQCLFWALAAIDGHAKNFSIFLKRGGAFQLTPLYDVISAYPLLRQNQLSKQKLKMAMALKGQNTHYAWQMVSRRHFISTAKQAKFSPKLMEAIIDEIVERMDEAVSQVASSLPPQFPSQISEAIFEGLLNFKNRLNP